MSIQIDQISIAEIVAQTKHLELTARRLVNDSLQSDYKSSFRGRGMEFDEVRAYSLGDDVRDIDWNVTARMNEPFIKTFIEERQLTTYFVADISASEDFGSRISKRAIMAEITALLGFTAFFSNDRIGMLLFSDSIEKVVPPAHSHSHLLRIIRDIYYFQGKSRLTNISQSLHSVSSMVKKKSIIFLLSDFFDKNYETALAKLARKHEVIPIVIYDKIEHDFSSMLHLPIVTELEDIETGISKLVSLQHHSITNNSAFVENYRKIFRKLGLEYAEINADTDYVKTIDLLLRKHARRL